MKTFSRKTLAFIETASRQKSETWLDRHRDEYEEYIKLPLQEFAREMKTRLARVATGYHFPQRGIGRMRRSKLTAQEYGGPYRNYLSYSASRPAASRFDRNPNLFFLIYPFDEDGEKVLCAGGFYMPS